MASTGVVVAMSSTDLAAEDPGVYQLQIGVVEPGLQL